MKRFIVPFCHLAIGVLLVATTAPISADAKEKYGVKRGPEHKLLAELVGTFDANVKVFSNPDKPPLQVTGVLKRKLIHDDNFLQESFSGKLLDAPFTYESYIGFDAAKKKYTYVGFNTRSTNMTVMYGAYDTANKRIDFLGDDFGIGRGKNGNPRGVLKIINANEQTLETYMLFERQNEIRPLEFRTMEITYTRKKDKKAEKK